MEILWWVIPSGLLHAYLYWKLPRWDLTNPIRPHHATYALVYDRKTVRFSNLRGHE